MMKNNVAPWVWKSSLLLLALIAPALCLGVDRAQAGAPGKPTLEAWAARIHGGWVGKVAAGSGALPTENQPREKILAKYGELKNPPQKPTSKGPLDDTTLALLGWHAACDHGPNFTTADVAREWVDHLTDADLKGGGYGREFLNVLARLKQGEHPPIHTGTARAEWIAAQMRAEIWGMLAPGDPARAAEYARRDAEVLNVGNGIYAAQFVAALASCLMVNPDIPGAIAAAQQQIPADSRLAGLIRDVIQWHAQKPADWDQAWRTFTETYCDRSLEKSFAQWSPDWAIETDGWPEAEVLGEYLGRKNVLRTHPFSIKEAARLSSEVTIPSSGGTLHLWVTCHELPLNVDWLLRLTVENVSREMPISRVQGKQQWQEVTLDLKPGPAEA